MDQEQQLPADRLTTIKIRHEELLEQTLIAEDIELGTNGNLGLTVRTIWNAVFRHLTFSPCCLLSDFSIELVTKGFISDILRIQLQYSFFVSDESNVEIRHFSTILKILSIGRMLQVYTEQKQKHPAGIKENTSREYSEFIVKAHNNECHFYNRFAQKVLTHVEAMMPGVRIPRFYACQPFLDTQDIHEHPTPFLLLEDLLPPKQLERSLQNVPFSRSLSREQSEAAIQQLAHFHAACICILSDSPDHGLDPGDFNLNCEDELHIAERLCNIPETDYFRANRSIIERLIAEEGKRSPAYAHQRFPGLPPTICHGDYWSNNFLFRLAPDCTMSGKLGALLDFQCVYPGTGINDLIRLVYVCVSPELRRKHFTTADWIALYQSTLQGSLAALNRLDLLVGRSIDQINGQLIPWHQLYEIVFQLFISINVLMRTKAQDDRREIIDRMIALVDDNKQLIVEAN